MMHAGVLKHDTKEACVFSYVSFTQLAFLLPLMIIIEFNAVHCRFLPESTLQQTLPFNITADLQVV